MAQLAQSWKMFLDVLFVLPIDLLTKYRLITNKNLVLDLLSMCKWTMYDKRWGKDSLKSQMGWYWWLEYNNPWNASLFKTGFDCFSFIWMLDQM